MDRSAIEAIRENQTFDIKALQDTAVPAIVIPERARLESVEHLQDQPTQFEAKFCTHIITEFASYTDKQLKEDSAIYVDPDRMSAVAIFDHGSYDEPKWAKNKALLSLQSTPLYNKLITHNERPLEQQSLIDFLSDWEENITVFDEEKKGIPFQTGINRIRKLTINKTASAEVEQGDFKATASAMETVEIKSGQDKIPAYFEIKLEPYEKFRTRVFRCKLRAVTSDKALHIRYRIDALQAIEADIADEFKEIIDNKTSGNASIYLGTMDIR